MLPLLLHQALLHPVVLLLHPDYLQYLYHPVLKPFSKFSSPCSIMWPNILIITLACSKVYSFIYVHVFQSVQLGLLHLLDHAHLDDLVNIFFPSALAPIF